MMTKSIDLNADLGEGGAFDADLMSVVTSCNIACGGHAGDEASMKIALQLAQQHGVAAGAHPSFPDRANFGRSRSSLSGPDLAKELRQQVMVLKTIADDLGVALTHLKPHGALYNMAARDAGLSETIANVMSSTLPGARLVGPPGSATETVARQLGVRYTSEGFADRAYEADGQLRDRKLTGAVLPAGRPQTKQAIEIAVHQSVSSYDGDRIALPVHSICVHGDTPGAFESAVQIKTSLLQHEISICAPG